MIFDRAFCAVLAALLLVGVALAPDGFARVTTLLGACACIVIARRAREVAS